MSTFVGFGFGAIQGGLFLPEAFASGFFNRLVVSEIDQETVDRVRARRGAYFCNIAHADRLQQRKIDGIEIYNPLVPDDREKLVSAIAEAQEMCTALPSFKLYDMGETSVAKLISDGLKRKISSEELPSVVIYAAENDTRAATRLREACLIHFPNLPENRIIFSETVIAKMCSVVTDPVRISTEKLNPMVKGFDKAFLVEAFNRILIDKQVPRNFTRGLNDFLPKCDLEPFAISKFLGHNAMHALLGYLARDEGIAYMHEAGKRQDLMETVRRSFIEEAGVGLRQKYNQIEDSLFTEDGFRDHAEEALVRMVNPFLRDPVARVTRDPVRKLGWDDRLLGAMRLALDAGVQPAILARGAALALKFACEENNWTSMEEGLGQIWQNVTPKEQNELRGLILAQS
jgi:mannitol-1-phosphate 5-dehydrogenase